MIGSLYAERTEGGWGAPPHGAAVGTVYPVLRYCVWRTPSAVYVVTSSGVVTLEAFVCVICVVCRGRGGADGTPPVRPPPRAEFFNGVVYVSCTT